jgi:hypothetical protein
VSNPELAAGQELPPKPFNAEIAEIAKKEEELPVFQEFLLGGLCGLGVTWFAGSK